MNNDRPPAPIPEHRISQELSLFPSHRDHRRDRYNLIKTTKMFENIMRIVKKRRKINTNNYSGLSHRYQVHGVFFVCFSFLRFFSYIILSPAFLSCFHVQCAFLHRHYLWTGHVSSEYVGHGHTEDRHAAFFFDKLLILELHKLYVLNLLLLVF